MTIPPEILSKAREIYEGSWPDPVTAIAEAIMQAGGVLDVQETWGPVGVRLINGGDIVITQDRDMVRVSNRNAETFFKALQQIVNENREVSSW